MSIDAVERARLIFQAFALEGQGQVGPSDWAFEVSAGDVSRKVHIGSNRWLYSSYPDSNPALSFSKIFESSGTRYIVQALKIGSAELTDDQGQQVKFVFKLFDDHGNEKARLEATPGAENLHAVSKDGYPGSVLDLVAAVRELFPSDPSIQGLIVDVCDSKGQADQVVNGVRTCLKVSWPAK